MEETRSPRHLPRENLPLGMLFLLNYMYFSLGFIYTIFKKQRKRIYDAFGKMVTKVSC